MGSRFLVWGAGGHGKVVADLLRACGHHVVGFVDSDAQKMGREVEPGGARVVLAEREFLDRIEATGLPSDDVDAVALAIGDNGLRAQALASIDPRCLPALVHPAATVSPSVIRGQGSVVFARAVINAASRIGRSVIINSAAVVEHDCVISDCVHVSPGAVLAGGVEVGARSWIGAGATVIEGVRVGKDVTVGAGAVVLRDIQGGRVVAGVPARTLRRP